LEGCSAKDFALFVGPSWPFVDGRMRNYNAASLTAAVNHLL